MSKQRFDDADEIRRRLDERLEDLLTAYYPGWVSRGGKGYLSPKGPKQLGSFQVNIRGARRGQWYRFSQQIGGGTVELLSYALTGGAKAYDIGFREARAFLGMSDQRSEADEEERRDRQAREAAAAEERRANRARAEDKRRARRAETAGEMWGECVPIAGTLAEQYLHDRGLPTPPSGWPEVLGFHSELEWDLGATFESGHKAKSGPFFPCLLGRVQDISGETIAVWRIYLDPVTGGKADVENPKVGFGPSKGGAVRIGGVGPKIGIAEGIETALGAWSLVGYRFPVWSGLSTSMSSVELPLEVKKVVVFPDGDRPMKRDGEEYVVAEPAGRGAARRLKERLSMIGIPCVVEAEPAMGLDYLDIWNTARGLR